MPTNLDLIASIQSMSIEKSVETPNTDGKNNIQLTAILKELNMDELEESKVDEPIVKTTGKFVIAKGKAITTKRGILSDGDEIKDNDLPGGSEALNSLIKSGHIDKS